jgi:hypothetical protein
MPINTTMYEYQGRLPITVNLHERGHVRPVQIFLEDIVTALGNLEPEQQRHLIGAMADLDQTLDNAEVTEALAAYFMGELEA